VVSHFGNLILPSFESKVRQKIGECEVRLAHKIDKIAEVKFRVERRKKAKHNKLAT
jgi:hypothetical protein